MPMGRDPHRVALALAATAAFGFAGPLALADPEGTTTEVWTQYTCQYRDGHVEAANGIHSPTYQRGVTDEKKYEVDHVTTFGFIVERRLISVGDDGGYVFTEDVESRPFTSAGYRWVSASERVDEGISDDQIYATCTPDGTFIAECLPQLVRVGSCLK